MAIWLRDSSSDTAMWFGVNSPTPPVSYEYSNFFSITVQEGVQTGVWTSSIPDLVATEGTPFSYDYSHPTDGGFDEFREGSTGSGFPAWHNLDLATGVGSGTPDQTEVLTGLTIEARKL